ncbi:hypothetical protein HDU97_010094 [Phlyctochytrium planicorne]|nr:hypothetical protein HDU97_010094 [Phlyctochytrium planicorne]
MSSLSTGHLRKKAKLDAAPKKTWFQWLSGIWPIGQSPVIKTDESLPHEPEEQPEISPSAEANAYCSDDADDHMESQELCTFADSLLEEGTAVSEEADYNVDGQECNSDGPQDDGDNDHKPSQSPPSPSSSPSLIALDSAKPEKNTPFSRRLEAQIEEDISKTKEFAMASSAVFTNHSQATSKNRRYSIGIVTEDDIITAALLQSRPKLKKKGQVENTGTGLHSARNQKWRIIESGESDEDKRERILQLFSKCPALKGELRRTEEIKRARKVRNEILANPENDDMDVVRERLRKLYGSCKRLLAEVGRAPRAIPVDNGRKLRKRRRSRRRMEADDEDDDDFED